MVGSLHAPRSADDIWFVVRDTVHLVVSVTEGPGFEVGGSGIGWSDDPVFEPRCRLTMSGCTSDGKEVKDVFGRPKMCLGRFRTVKKPKCQWRGCPTAGDNLDSDWMTISRHYIAEISPNMTINHNKPNQTKLAYNFKCISEFSLLLIDSSAGTHTVVGIFTNMYRQTKYL